MTSLDLRRRTSRKLRSITGHIYGSFLLFVFLLVLALMISVAVYVDQDRRAFDRRQLAAQEAVVGRLQRFESEIEEGVDAISHNPLIQDYLYLAQSASSQNLFERSVLRNTIEQHLNHVVAAYPSLLGASIVQTEGYVTSSSQRITWPQMVETSHGQTLNHGFQRSPQLDGLYYRTDITYAAARHARSQMFLGELWLRLDQGLFRDLLAPLQLSQNDSVLLYHQDKLLYGSTTAEEYDYRSEDEAYMSRVYIFEGGKWTTKLIYSSSEIYQNANLLAQTASIVIGILAFVFLTVSILVARNIQKPRKQIEQLLKRPVNELRYAEPHPDAKNEFEDIYNRTLNLIKYLMDLSDRHLAVSETIQEAEYRRRQAENRVVKWTIRGDFLYNTLECMRSMALVSGVDGIGQVTEGLAELFRYIHLDRIFATVEEEVKLLRAYERIIEVIYPNEIAVSYDLDPGIMHYSLLRMTLQPLLENAIKHAKVSGRVLNILIRASMDGRRGCIEVIDDGAGISEETLRNLQAKISATETTTTSAPNYHENHVGLLNIATRLRAYFGELGSLEIDSSGPSGGTTVTLYFLLTHDPKEPKDYGY